MPSTWTPPSTPPSPPAASAASSSRSSTSTPVPSSPTRPWPAARRGRWSGPTRCSPPPARPGGSPRSTAPAAPPPSAGAGGRAAPAAPCRTAAFRGAVGADLVTPLSVFVNVEPEVLDTAPLAELLEIAEQAPGRLQVVLKITERALAARPAELLRTVERVRSVGWGIAVDDVGAESLSLAFLPLLRPDVVKLDLRLVQERPGPEIAEIMNAVNAYAERSGALVLAEGIETEQHLAMARALGATLGQGWLFGRPGAGPVADRPVAALTLPGAGAGHEAAG